MKSQLHTVLGANGATGIGIIKELKIKKLPIRAVSRSQKPLDGLEAMQADLLNPQATRDAIKGSGYVYLAIGLPYSSKIWKEQWPVIMTNVIEACSEHDAKLIFLDNMYMYEHPLPVPFDENRSQATRTVKGKIRKEIVLQLLDAISSGKIEGVIGRATDFYGSYANNSLFHISFLERMLDGKNPQLLVKPDILHTYANTTDNGRALVELALDNSTHGQVWHLPVGEPITFHEILEICNRVLGGDFKLSVIATPIRKILMLFMQPLRELEEMRYQFDQPYVMSWEKFRKHFPNFKVTTYEDGIRDMIKTLGKK